METVCVVLFLCGLVTSERALTFGGPRLRPTYDRAATNPPDPIPIEEKFDVIEPPETPPGKPPFTLTSSSENVSHIYFPPAARRRITNYIFNRPPTFELTPTIKFASKNLSLTFGDSEPVIESPFESAYNASRQNCSLEDGLVVYNEECYTIFTQGPCQDNEWLILNPFYPACTIRPCSLGQLLHNGSCHNATTNPCGLNEILYVEFNADVYCDCKPTFIYDKTLQSCLYEHERGSCPYGHYLQMDNGTIGCIENPCVLESSLLNPGDDTCYHKDFNGRCDTKGDNFVLMFHHDGFVSCVSIGSRNIFEVPALDSCPPGSKRDYLNECQKVLRNKSFLGHRAPAMFSAKYSYCPTGYLRYPNNECMKANSLFA